MRNLTVRSGSQQIYARIEGREGEGRRKEVSEITQNTGMKADRLL